MAFFGDVWSPPLCPGPLFSLRFGYIRASALSLFLSSSPQGPRIAAATLSAITWRRLTLASHHVLLFFSPWPTSNSHTSAFFLLELYFQWLQSHKQHTAARLGLPLSAWPAVLTSRAHLNWFFHFFFNSEWWDDCWNRANWRWLRFPVLLLSSFGDRSDADAICLPQCRPFCLVFPFLFIRILWNEDDRENGCSGNTFPPPLLLFYQFDELKQKTLKRWRRNNKGHLQN